MKKLLATSFLSLGLSISAFAANSTPITTKGEQTNPAYAGVSSCMITASTGTSAVLCATGSGVVLQVIGSSVTTTDYITLRDSATANTSSAESMRVSASGLAGVYYYPRFKNGLSANVSVAPVAGTGAWTIIYTKDLQ